MPRRSVLPLLVLAGLAACPVARAQSLGEDAPAKARTGKSPSAITLSVPQSYDFSQSVSASPGADQARRLRNAPLPDPATVKKPSDTLRDPNTGADTTAFGSAYSYANPLYGPQGPGSVQNAASKSAGTPAPQGLQFTVFQWGYPRPPMPKVPGEDLTAAPPPVPVIDFAVQADDGAALDARASATIGRAVQAYGRAALTRITIERPAHAPDCCKRYPDLVRAALIGNGLSPDHLLSGHQIRVVMTTLPMKK
ncbi:hypothetical protein NFI95_07240 [Acetobacteraceae bacterium KSS8]|uniref:Uncharacterized protein n=1 Tax=Endosaccharibacter trunci TaxID=2812733 RepID=A0ABT1W5T3_9PROT|nr:hypothetical protein [Acetobacteraceae bacterium KSS8]